MHLGIPTPSKPQAHEAQGSLRPASYDLRPPAASLGKAFGTPNHQNVEIQRDFPDGTWDWEPFPREGMVQRLAASAAGPAAYLLTWPYGHEETVPADKISFGVEAAPRDREEAIRWARGVLGDPNAVILDTESTGLGSDAEAVSLAVIDMQGDVVLDLLLRPAALDTPDLAAALSKNGIPVEVLQDPAGPHRPYAEHSAFIQAALDCCRVVAYNTRFDKRIIEHSAEVARCTPPFAAWECAQFAYRAFRPNGRPTRLVKALAERHLAVKDAHTALGDVRMTLALLRSMAREPLPEDRT